MENNIQPEIIRFLDQYYCNPDVPEEVFLNAVREKLDQMDDPEQQEMFVYGIIERGKLIRDSIQQHVREHEVYKLTGDEF